MTKYTSTRFGRLYKINKTFVVADSIEEAIDLFRMETGGAIEIYEIVAMSKIHNDCSQFVIVGDSVVSESK